MKSDYLYETQIRFSSKNGFNNSSINFSWQVDNKYEIFLKFRDSNFSQPGLCSKLRARLCRNFARLAAVSSGE